MTAAPLSPVIAKARAQLEQSLERLHQKASEIAEENGRARGELLALQKEAEKLKETGLQAPKLAARVEQLTTDRERIRGRLDDAISRLAAIVEDREAI